MMRPRVFHQPHFRGSHLSLRGGAWARAAAVLIVAGSALVAPRAQAQTAQEGPSPLRPVISEFVVQGTPESRSFPGLVIAKSEVDLGFQTAGRIATREVSVGDTVRKDMILATLDQVTLEQDVVAAQAAVNAAQAAADLAAQSLGRVRKLEQRGVATPAQLEAAQAQNDAAAAQLIAARAQHARAQDAAKFAVLRAPMDGIITATPAEVGMGVAAGTAVVTLAAQEGREAVIDVPSEMIGLLPPEAAFHLRRRAETYFPNPDPITGYLRLIEPVADANTRSRRLRVTLQDGGEALRLGSLVTAEFDSAANPLLTIPRNAILDDTARIAAAGVSGIKGPIVWRVSGTPRRAQAVAVTLGAQINLDTPDDDIATQSTRGPSVAPEAALAPEIPPLPVSAPQRVGRVIVLGGLAAGDEILTRGVQSVYEGMTLGERVE